jgi:hypothetical protein
MTAELPLRRFEKYPDEKPLLGFRFKIRGGNTGVTLVSAPPITIKTTNKVPGSADGDVPIGGQSFDADELRVQALFGPGGMPGEEYLVTIKGNRSDGQQPLEQRIILYIKKV